MIIKASQRGGGKALGMHLLKTEENEHVEVHQIRGFVSDDIVGAMKEAYAVSRGTKCRQFLFSVSLNPPETERVGVDVFEAVADRIEKKTGLNGQPRIIVFHEKEGRRHAHVVWSRIDVDSMTAVNMSHFKTKLRDISRETYLEHDWRMPKGLMNSEARDPRNFTLAEWQQAKRMRKQNEVETYAALRRDREQRDALVGTQLQERQRLQVQLREGRQRQAELLHELRHDRSRLREAFAPLTEKSPPEKVHVRPSQPASRQSTEKAPARPARPTVEPTRETPPAPEPRRETEAGRPPVRDHFERLAALRDTSANLAPQPQKQPEPERDVASRLQEFREHRSMEPRHSITPDRDR